MRRTIFAIALSIAAAARAQVSENITVARMLLELRVTDRQNEPVLGLTPDDVDVLVDGKPVPIESVLWYADSAAARAAAGEEQPAEPQGRLFVVFVQNDFARSNVRLTGQMKFFQEVHQIFDALDAEDRVAVLSFDSHLKLRLDFSTDKERVLAAVQASTLIDDPPMPDAASGTSLVPLLDATAMKNVASPEKALLMIADALHAIPGDKSMLFLGWGLGQLSGVAVVLSRDYTAAARAIVAAHTTMYVLNTGLGGQLALGLKKAAVDSGGFYGNATSFATIAMERFHRAMQGHYEVEIRRPDEFPRGTHRIEVKVKRKAVTVMAPVQFVDE